MNGQIEVDKEGLKKYWKIIVSAILVLIVALSFVLGRNDDVATLLGLLTAIFIFSLITAYFINIFRKIRKESETPASGQVTTVIRIFSSFVCLFLVGLIFFVAYLGKGQSEPYAAIGAIMVSLILFGVFLLWWLCEFISLIIKLIKKQKSSRFQTIFVLTLPLIFIIGILLLL